MLVVRGVAAVAGLGDLLVAAADVARIASHGRMRPGQLEVRLVMIEPTAGPALDAVALAAGLGELPMVHVIILVAADAGHGCLAPCDVRLVAGAAFERGLGGGGR